MSNTQMAFLNRSNVPDRGALQASIDRLGFNLTLHPVDGDHFVGLAIDHERHDFPLARRERLRALLEISMPVDVRAILGIELQCRVDPVQP